MPGPAGIRRLNRDEYAATIRAIDRRPQQRLRRVGARTRVVNASAGFRGAVSMAAASASAPTPATIRTWNG